MNKKLIILGSGPAGWTAALYAARAGFEPIVLAGMQKGGQLTTTTEVDNWPGDFSGLQGQELIDRMESHALKFGAQLIHDHIHNVDFSQKKLMLLGDNTTYICDSLIICTGASAKYLGLASEEKFKGKGVSACATCDGFFYRNKEVAVVGGGNTAVEEALYLSNIASKVYLIHRKDKFKAENIMIKKLMEKVQEGKIVLKLNCVTHEVVGNDYGVTGIEIIKDQGLKETIAVHGIFIAIGHKPNTDIFKNYLHTDDYGYLITKRESSFVTATNIPGVFAAGDVADNIYRQAITSAGSGCQAALDAVRYLEAL